MRSEKISIRPTYGHTFFATVPENTPVVDDWVSATFPTALSWELIGTSKWETARATINVTLLNGQEFAIGFNVDVDDIDDWLDENVTAATDWY